MTPLVLANVFNPTTLLIILAIALLVFGNRLPSIGKNLGKSIVGFKKGLKEGEEADDDDDDDDDEIDEPVAKKPKQLASKTGQTTGAAREKQKVAVDENDE